jgi:hypothetical protein
MQQSANFGTSRQPSERKSTLAFDFSLKQCRPGPQGKREIIKLMLLSRTPSLVLYLIRNVI